MFISEESSSKSHHIFEFHYHDAPGVETSWNPNMDIYETENDLILLIEAAGLDEQSLKLHSIENRLVLTGERHQESQDSIMRYHQMEIQFMPFQKTIVLPCEVEIDKVNASYQNGLLRIRIPKECLEGQDQ
jgi:HSP20 family protein